MSGATSAVMIGATVASAAVAAAGQMQQGAAAKASGNYNAQVASQNAALATQNAQYVGAQGEQNVAATGSETKAKMAAITANQGASGVMMNSGSSVDVRQSEAQVGMMNALNVRSQAVKQAYGLQTNAVNDTAQAQLDKAQGANAQTGAMLNAGATMMGGVGKAAGYMGGSSSTMPLDSLADPSLPWSTGYKG